MIGSGAAFPRFVLHDLRLSARGLASRFGALTPGRLGALAALLFTALHAAAWPVACWLIDVEDRPNGPAGHDDSSERRDADRSVDHRPVDDRSHSHACSDALILN
jgi:hypothetical protein